MRKRLIELVVLVSIALGAGPVGAAIWSWSTTASTNATADPSINWAEGMAPSSVNDSARAMMAALAAWRNDISAVNTTGGSSTAYTLTTSEGVNTTPANGQMLSFIAHATNGISPTLRVDSGNTYPIWLNGAPVAAATMIVGTPYRAAFNVANAAWLLEGGYGNPYSTALGGIMLSTVSTPPNSNFVAPYGQCISTTTYAAYWVAMGSPASGACPGGQFAVIDMRGRAVAALDTLPGSTAANRLTSSATGCGTAMTTVGASCANGVQGATIPISQLPSITSDNASVSLGVSVNTVNWVASSCCDSTQFSVQASGPASAVSLTGAVVSKLQSTGAASGSVTVTSQLTTNQIRPQVPPIVGLIPYLRIL